MIVVVIAKYYRVKETDTIIRTVGTNPDGSFIADALFGRTEDEKGWWRLVPITPEKLAADTVPLEGFHDVYPQEFMPYRPSTQAA